ncbi:2,3-bisphosphoglycerate-dependent phosphoglycerate mutase [Candidatus Protochlamydia amoebophila]|uniref:2,3-bisphosphoglycerate-dependent phosphoglycerate mutase n=1 Tax=Candidatus Protochlamydia amoebophila TaxID=362787 RepID=A0A0C1HHU4_9BACT|nr:2,3-bisphosphoglycerate-dependent phosphoglycerate mutase [Candidatus Protochlamydia amoebophila]KIC74168.1 2,3-bisphosphoglycerate-dependent phosphoglycerate mutase [Candidatus Protochlamydia amoebophila]
MVKLILMRHGQSQWNLANLFTGWVDIPLSFKGIEEAIEAGKQIKNYPIDLIFTSSLIRAQMTAMLAMSVHTSGKVPVILHTGEGRLEEWARIYSSESQSQTIPVIRAWELNERMYGELQGINKEEMAKKYGAEQVHIWRRSFDVPPPNGESLQMTAARTIPYFENTIVPHLKEKKNIFIAAHGNSLRSIIMKLDGLTTDQVVKLELATGVPVIYDFNHDKYIKQQK